MVTKCSVFIATSLDGFISRPDGRIDWLKQADSRIPAGEDCGYESFVSKVDTLVMGCNTFELARSFGEWPYGAKPVVVLSSTMKSLPTGVPSTVTLACECLTTLVARLAAQGKQHLYIDGGITIQRFLAVGLIDEITVTRIPVLIGTGRPLFGSVASDVHLDHVSTRVFEFGFVQDTYLVVKSIENHS